MTPELIILLSTIIGLCLGSFTTLLIWRLHNDEKGILLGRSRCVHCKKTLKFWNLIPLASYVMQAGKCSFCGKKISSLYPLTEITFGVTFLIFASKFYDHPYFLIIMLMVFFTLVLFFYDVLFMEVDQRICWPAIIVAFLFAFLQEQNVLYYLLGGAIGFLFYAIQYYISEKKWVGSGDMELGLFLGLLLGWQYTIGALIVAYILGMFVAIPLLLSKKVNAKTAVPMGAFLMPATLIFLYAGDKIWSTYIQFLGF